MTISLCVITRDLTLELITKLESYRPHVDAIYCQVNNPGVIPSLPQSTKITYSRYKWTDDFSAARNNLLKQVKTDWWAWFDSDDVIEGISGLRALVQDTTADIIHAPYEYQHEGNEVVITQWRERIIRTSLPGAWTGRVHEVFTPTVTPEVARTRDIVWVHETDEVQQQESMKRNHVLLTRELEDDPHNPRSLYYMGLSHVTSGDVLSGIEYLNRAAQSQSGDEQYFTLHKIAELYAQTDDYPRSDVYNSRAATLIPSYPDAYLGLAQAAYEQRKFRDALTWLYIAKMQGVPETDQVIDPTKYTYRPYALRALCLFELGQYVEAYRMAREVAEANPDYRIITSRLDMFRDAAMNDEMAGRVRDLVVYTATTGGDVQALTAGLPDDLRTNSKVVGLKHSYTKPRVWPKDSIVYWCGKGAEPWGPDYMEGGMGGSEEAVVNLTTRWANAMRNIVIFNQRSERSYNWHPWYDFNPADTYGTLIVWRLPELGSGIKADKKLLDLHDLIEPERLYKHLHEYTYVMFKSQWHRDQYPEVPDAMARVITNGINREDFV